MSHKAHKFKEANERWPVVYASFTGNGWFYRLLNGLTFDLSLQQCREIGTPRFA